MRRTRAAGVLSAIAVAAIVGCSSAPSSSGPAAPAKTRVPIGQLPDVDISQVLAHTKMLSSDEFEGRAPGTPGEARTVSYLIDEFRRVGLKPGNPDGTYVQKVPLVGITP